MEVQTLADNVAIVRARWEGTRPAPGGNFDKSATAGTMGFELFVLLAFAAALVLLRRLTNRIPLRFCIMACGVLVFELFTAPMWRNLHLGGYAYLFQQVSWILTIGWSTLFLSVVTAIDHRCATASPAQRFFLYLAVLTPVTFCFEVLLNLLGVRGYAPEVLASVSGLTAGGVPIEVFYYVPVFSTLVISFYKYWSLVLDATPVCPAGRIPWLRTLGFSVLGVLLFELMVEPMVQNLGFAGWSYLYRDVSLIMTGCWIVVMTAAVCLVELVTPHWGIGNRFMLALGIIALFATPLEAWLIASGMRVYGPSAVANFSGLTIPWTAVPLEVACAVPCYFALIISFVRYGEIIRVHGGGSHAAIR